VINIDEPYLEWLQQVMRQAVNFERSEREGPAAAAQASGTQQSGNNR
jgi:hypothetical protein